MRVQSLGWGDPREESVVTQCSTLAWRSPWAEGPGGRQSLGSPSVRHDWVTQHSAAQPGDQMVAVASVSCCVSPRAVLSQSALGASSSHTALSKAGKCHSCFVGDDAGLEPGVPGITCQYMLSTWRKEKSTKFFILCSTVNSVLLSVCFKKMF